MCSVAHVVHCLGSSGCFSFSKLFKMRTCFKLFCVVGIGFKLFLDVLIVAGLLMLFSMFLVAFSSFFFLVDWVVQLVQEIVLYSLKC